jgi:hypothetical protein
MRCVFPVRSGWLWSALVAGLFVFGVGGCAVGERAPSFEVREGARAEATAEGVVVRFVLEGENENGFELPLREVRYRVRAGGERVFAGARVARVTLPRAGSGVGSPVIELPAAVPMEVARRSGLVGGSDPVRVRVSGSVVYVLPGSIAEIFFDSGLRRPEAGFSGEFVVEPVEAGGAG